jgi:6-phosphogluconolactonase
MNRRHFIKGVCSTVALTALTVKADPKFLWIAKDNEKLLFVGTYTTGTTSKGIYIYRFNINDGDLSYVSTAENAIDPSFLVADRSGRYLYVVNETVEYEGKKSGAVSSFAIDQQKGTLNLLNKTASLGGVPCDITVTNDGRDVIVANYVGGNLAVFPVDQNGKLGRNSDLVQHTGTGPNKDRQEAAHAHSIALDKNNIFAASCDLGSDKIYIYKLDNKTGHLTPNPAQEFFQSRPGAGPRHLVFHQKHDLAFVINELDCTVTSLRFDPVRGTLTEIQTLSTLPKDWTGVNTCAEIQISPDGQFLYGSNRGHDSIVSYMIDELTGKLSLIGHTSSGGQVPRNFIIDPSGKYLLAANQKSNNIVVFAVDRRTGKIEPTGSAVDVPAPVCLDLV